MTAPRLRATSMPTSSSSVSGPTGKPKRVIARSTSSIGGAFLEHAPPRSCRARGPGWRSPGPSRDHDHVLAEPASERHRGRDRPGAVSGDDDLEQRHLLDRREEVHAEDALRPPAPRAAISPMGIDEVLLAKTASGASPPPPRRAPALEVEVLEDRLDHEVGAPEAAVVERPRERRALPLELAAVRLPPLAAAPRRCLAHVRARARCASKVVSLRRTCRPRVRRGPAMPAPMRPAPTTPSLRTCGLALPGGMPASFLISWVAKKTDTSARDTSETESSPK